MFKRPFSKRKKIVWIVAGSFIILLIALRIALPYILLRVVNRELTRIDGYQGHVEDIDVALIRGAYTIENIRLDKTGGKIPVPFFSATKMDLSVEWNSLFHGAFVGEIVVSHPLLNFVKGPTEATSQTQVDNDWIDVVDKLLPLKLNRVEINDGEIHYRDYYSSPRVDIYSHAIQIIAENLSNARHHKELLPSTVAASALVYGGTAGLKMKLDALNRTPTFDANAELKNVDMKNLNDFLRAYGNFDISQGTLGLYTEAAAKGGRIKGYTKPIIKDLKVVNWKEDKKKPLKLLWETVVQTVAWVFKNHPKDQLATRISFEGDVKNPDINVWYLIGQVLRNAFIQALYPSLENSVNINSAGDDKKQTILSNEFEKSKKP
ncbi:MAG: hypothetical protein JWM28_4094 [Chitinophagaceae bacterium]|nr:hypothetical protein [Chitinophagaceae bacterium]